MNRSATSVVGLGVLPYAAERAMLAPSIHNTQPWRFVLTRDALEIHADESRHLHVLDSRRRQLHISCGCALFNARVGVAAAGYQAIVQRRPDPDRPELLARIAIGERCELAIAALDDEIERRRTNRRPFMGNEPPGSAIRTWISAGRDEGVDVVPVPMNRRAEVAQLGSRADAVQRADLAYAAELKAWTTSDLNRPDGIQARTLPYAPDWPTPNDAVAIRDLDVNRMGWLPPTMQSSANQCLLVIGTDEDDARSWLRAGEALERIWLELTRDGYWASPLNQVIEVPETHQELRAALGLTTHPQLLLRIGRAPAVPASPRRAADDVIDDLAPSQSR